MYRRACNTTCLPSKPPPPHTPGRDTRHTPAYPCSAQATLVGDKLWLFGGEDCHRRPLADLYCLDLASLSWSAVEVPGKPAHKPPPRCGHAAVVHGDKLVVFGGEAAGRGEGGRDWAPLAPSAAGECGAGTPRPGWWHTPLPLAAPPRRHAPTPRPGGSIANCLADCWLLDLDTLQWVRPAVKGELPAPRAGHASVLVGDSWYVLGGGNNVKGAPAGRLHHACSASGGEPVAGAAAPARGSSGE